MVRNEYKEIIFENLSEEEKNKLDHLIDENETNFVLEGLK